MVPTEQMIGKREAKWPEFVEMPYGLVVAVGLGSYTFEFGPGPVSIHDFYPFSGTIRTNRIF